MPDNFSHNVWGSGSIDPYPSDWSKEREKRLRESADACSRADAFFSEGKYTDALAIYNELVRLYKLDEYIVKQAETLNKLERYKEALKAINRVIQRENFQYSNLHSAALAVEWWARKVLNRDLMKPPAPPPPPAVDTEAAAHAAQKHRGRFESWPKGPNGVPMPPPGTGAYPAGRPQHTNGVPNIGRPQAPNGTPKLPRRFGIN